MNKRACRGFGRAMGSVMAMTAVLGSALMVMPQAAHAQGVRSYDIPAGPLATALNRFAEASGIKLFYDASLTNGLSSQGMRGSFGTAEALSRVLAGSGLAYRQTGEGAYTIERAPQPNGDARQLGPVRVEGGSAGEGTGRADASRDPGATDGTRAYTTHAVTIGKTALSIRETPQSVSIVTRQRIEDQNITDVGEALKFTTGMTLQSVGGVYTEHSALSRGASADYQLDGINQSVDSRAAQFDLAIYDRVEVLRGPAGLFRGAGSAGATINLVRKRALSGFHAGGTAGVGSWGTLRAEGDVSGSLSESGNIRARVVAVAEDRGSFLDRIDNSKYLGYGTVEFDFDDATTLALAATYQDARMDYFYGLPAYANGTLVNVPRSTSYGTPWAGGKLENLDLLAELEHRLGNGGRIKGTLRRSNSDRSSQTLFSGGGVDALGMQSLASNDEAIENRNTAADLFVDTPFTAFGSQHNILIGGDFQDYSQSTFRRAFSGFPRVNFFTFDPGAIPEPNFAAQPTATDIVAKTKSYGLYGQLRVKPVQPLTLIGGLRASWRDVRNFDRLTNRRTSGPDIKGEVTPYFGTTLEPLADWFVYGSYAEIFQPQSATTVQGTLLDPITGRQVELGVKGALMDQRLTLSAAVYRTTRSNEALVDPANPGFSIGGGKRRAEGFEAEVNGELAQGLHVTAGYAYTKTKILVAAVSQVGQAYAPTTPKHNLTLWGNYRFPAASALSGVEMGGGLRANSDFYSQIGTVRFAAGGYTVASALLAYNFDEKVKLSVNVENLFDRKYYTKVGNATANNYYGTPRSVMATLRFKY
ncbi:TonB-dependent siderophore receptor [Sphingomonas crocodyli]|uniref:TonB-dependent siderophore receptor n=1 Tax=Sphingomonas crocodyli TaxID=1979270 RepID=A0A437M029_9SPHN|nr:TonB-dependent siderophore receptor [Sphingomonas crocodyli]RVT90935.1 TonB-dependent siderophore receptor [Sphingomonas crocodyli]